MTVDILMGPDKPGIWSYTTWSKNPQEYIVKCTFWQDHFESDYIVKFPDGSTKWASSIPGDWKKL